MGRKESLPKTAGSHDDAAPYAAIRFVGFVSAFAIFLPSPSPRKLLLDLGRDGFGVYLIGAGGITQYRRRICPRGREQWRSRRSQQGCLHPLGYWRDSSREPVNWLA
jgi:hypothetical protein